MSLVESVGNVAVGFVINTSANYILLPVFGLHPTIADSAVLAVLFTVISITRTYILRRFFNAIR